MNPNNPNILGKVTAINDRKKQVYNFSILTAIVVVVLGVGAVKPSIETIVRLNSEIKERKQVVEDLETKINTINDLSIQYSAFESTVRDLKLIYPANGDFSLFLANIEAVADREGFNLNNISFGRSNFENIVGFQNLSPIAVQLSVTGRRERIIQLLQRLEEMPMFPVVKSISFTTDVDNDGNSTFSINLLIYEVNNETFYQ